MELGRECLKEWNYERVDELIWVKTNQLQRIIRTGRTGHWLNHGKEHCLIGVKGKPDPRLFNTGIDCDVIVAEVRATSHKPDEVYGVIERLSPGTRKVELFGRPHNVSCIRFFFSFSMGQRSVVGAVVKVFFILQLLLQSL